MRYFTLFILTILYAFSVSAQRKCGAEIAIQQKIQDNPSLLQVRERIEARQQAAAALLKRNRTLQRTTYNTVTIPVVVHIVLKNPNQVTDAQVYAQIDALNKDYAAANVDISALPAAWQARIGNAAIQFCLAQRTPDDSPTDGIERVVTSTNLFSIDDAAKAVKSRNTGGANGWDGNRYLNIWVCALAQDYLGIATFPGLYSTDQQGVAIHYTAFGTGGSAQSPYDKGRTVVHEIGHYFSLRHIWGDESACAIDDGINDTPLQGDHTYGCPAFPLIDRCTTDSPGVMFNNYMDYSDDRCMLLFTSDQADRMRVTLTDDRASLLSSNACTPLTVVNNDAKIVSILSPSGPLCENSIKPLIVLKNQGLNPLTSLKITYTTDNGIEHSINWTGNLASMKRDTVSLPESAPGEGPNLLQAYTSQPNGVTDEDLTNDTAAIAFQYYSTFPLPYTQGFEENTYPPAGWEIMNYDGNFTWELSNAAKTGSHSIVMRNLAYDVNGEQDDIISPAFDATGSDSLFLFFDVAAASYSGANDRGNSLWDSLLVFSTSDCGRTLDSVYRKGGPNFLTHRQALTTEFVPTSAEWRRDSINLTPIIKKGKFRLVFRNISNAENNVYIDNINLVTKSIPTVLREKGYIIGPVPVTNQLSITFLNTPKDLEYIALYNTMGQLVAKQPGAAINGANRFIFDLVNEPNGIYFVKLIYRTSVKTIKITKVR